LSCKEVDEGYEFSYTPFSSGKYLIAIKYGNINIAGSPYVAEITGINLNIDYIFILLFLMMFDYNIPPVYIFTYFCSICFSFTERSIAELISFINLFTTHGYLGWTVDVKGKESRSCSGCSYHKLVLSTLNDTQTIV
jgi:hypothetical protein